MDNNQENNNEGLFGARNENSVLFSLDSLSAIDNEAKDSSLNTDSEASGLINLNMLSQISKEGEQSSGTPAAAPMDSMVFREVVSKKSKRTKWVVIAVIAVLIIAFAGVVIFLVNDSREEKAKQDQLLALQKQEAIDKEKADAEKAAALQAEIDQLKADAAEQRKANDAEVEKKMKELQALKAAESANADNAAPAGGNTKKSSAAPAKAEDTAAKPAAPKGGAPKPDEVKAALMAASTKAKKCGKNGNLNLILNINSAGVATASAAGGSFQGTPTEKCIITVFTKQQYPTSGTGVKGVKFPVKL